MFQNILKLMVPLSKYNISKIKVILWYFKQEYVSSQFSRGIVVHVKNMCSWILISCIVIKSATAGVICMW